MKIRKQNNLDRRGFSDILGVHPSTVQSWEADGILPQPENIKRICELYGCSLVYFGEYYHVYFHEPGKRITEWKDRNGYTNADLCRLFSISDSGIKRLRSGRIALSVEMFQKLKAEGVFSGEGGFEGQSGLT